MRFKPLISRRDLDEAERALEETGAESAGGERDAFEFELAESLRASLSEPESSDGGGRASLDLPEGDLSFAPEPVSASESGGRRRTGAGAMRRAVKRLSRSFRLRKRPSSPGRSRGESPAIPARLVPAESGRARAREVEVTIRGFVFGREAVDRGTEPVRHRPYAVYTRDDDPTGRLRYAPIDDFSVA